jgi:hypothetical protein
MGMPAANPGSASALLDTNSSDGEAPGTANIFMHDDEADANLCADGDAPAANFAASRSKSLLAGATATTTEEFDSFGGGTGDRATAGNLPADENLRVGENLPADENFRADPTASPNEVPHWVTLATELLKTIGTQRPLAISEAELVRGWLERGATPDVLRGVFHTVLGRDNCPANPAMSYFDGAVVDMLEASKRASPATTTPRSDPSHGLVAETPPQTQGLSDTPEIAADCELSEADRSALVAAWAKIRARLQSEVGDGEFRNWLRPMILRRLDGDEVLLSLPTTFVRDWVRDHHGPRVTALWQAEFPFIRRVEFCAG